jgi:uncharacterized protein (TIGR03067 family)
MFTGTLMLGLMLAVAADKPAQDVKEVTDALAGYWDVTAAELDGVQSKEGLPYAKLVFTGDRLTVTRVQRPGEAKSPTEQNDARCKFDPKSKGIEVTFVNGPDQEKTFYGVYELKGDDLKVCWGESKDKRPTALSTKKGSGTLLLILKRGKP